MNPRKILVVDDSRLMQKMYSYFLHGKVLVCANHGLEALKCLDENPETDLILLDLNMPEMNGLEFLEQWSASPQKRDIPVILVTTEGSEEEVAHGLKVGATTSIEKPFEVDELQALIDSLP